MNNNKTQINKHFSILLNYTLKGKRINIFLIIIRISL